MKLKDLVEAVKPKNEILYQNDVGYIKGHFRDDGYYWVEKFFIYPEKRGQGLAKDLAKHIPEKSILLAQPLTVKGETMLDRTSLINFYKSLGFKERPDSNDNMIMVRN